MKSIVGFTASFFLLASMTKGQNIDLKGTIKDKAGAAIAGAEVKLMSSGLKDTSDAQGAFRIVKTSTGLEGFLASASAEAFQPVYQDGRGLQFTQASRGPVHLRVFDLAGKLESESKENLGAGTWLLDAGKLNMGIHVASLQAGAARYQFRFAVSLPQADQSQAKRLVIASVLLNGGTTALGKAAAAVDSLQVTRSFFTTTVIGVSSLVESNIAVTLDSAKGTTPFPTTWTPVSGYQTKVASNPQGQLKELTYDNTVLNKTGSNGRKVTVYLPPGYDAAMKYPVLYALHGIGGDHKEWISYNTNVDQIFNNLYAAKKIEPMIVVFPNGRARTDDRANAETSGPNVTAFNEFWTKDLKDFLIPFIEKTYSVYKDKEHRAILGYSMGGMQALNFGLGNPDYFTFVGALAPAPAGLGHPNVNTMNAAMMNTQFKRIFISTGTEDSFFGSSDTFQKALDAKGIKRIWVSVSGGKHDGSTWCPGIYNFAQILFK